MVDLTANYENNLTKLIIKTIDDKPITSVSRGEGVTHKIVKEVIAHHLRKKIDVCKFLPSPAQGWRCSMDYYSYTNRGYITLCPIEWIFAENVIRQVDVEKRYKKTKTQVAFIADISVLKSRSDKPPFDFTNYEGATNSMKSMGPREVMKNLTTVIIEITDTSKSKLKKMLRIIDSPVDYFEIYPGLIDVSSLFEADRCLRNVKCSGFFRNAERITKLSFCASNFYVHASLSTMWVDQKLKRDVDSKSYMEKGTYVIQFCKETKEFKLIITTRDGKLVNPSSKRYANFPIDEKAKTENYTWHYTEDFKGYWCAEFKEILQEVFLEAFRNHFNKLMHVQKNNKNYYLLYMRDNEINLPNFTFKRNVW